MRTFCGADPPWCKTHMTLHACMHAYESHIARTRATSTTERSWLIVFIPPISPFSVAQIYISKFNWPQHRLLMHSAGELINWNSSFPWNRRKGKILIRLCTRRHAKIYTVALFLWQIPPMLVCTCTGRNDDPQKAEFDFVSMITKQNPLFLLVAVRRMTHVGSNVNPAIDPKEFIFLCLIERNLRIRN